MVDAKARANPANDALMVGDATATNPVIPITHAEIRLKRTESHRLTMRRYYESSNGTRGISLLTSPHPIIRIGILQVVDSAKDHCISVCLTYGVDTPKHVPQELGRGTKST